MTAPSSITPFHLAIPVHDLSLARRFYGDILGCPEGRSCEHWIDFDFMGHQLVTHLSPEECGQVERNRVDGKDVPVRHFGLILDWARWEQLSVDLVDRGVRFIVEPYVRFEDEPGEQGTMFVLDPSGNALEFKTFRDMNQIFAR